MKTKATFDQKVREIRNTFIELSDGTHLAARIWLPENAEKEPVPGILEYIPYRKNDGTAERDSMMHPYFAGHGYAAVRVDLRGSGESEGLLEDEYLEQELQDGIEVIQWIADQQWCSGEVGIIGKSWGGFNGLQLAHRQPDPLKAVISVCSTDDRYADDIHYMGGCLLGDHLSWASVMFALNALPPDPAIVGERWRDMWHERLEGNELWLKKWLEHQHRDDYWGHGSVCEDIDRIKTPVMAVSGWADGYTNSVFRLLRDLKAPCKGLVGPWSHKYPHSGIPGPAIGFLQECIRWWDHWLKGKDNGVDKEGKLYAYMQDSVEPTTYYHFKPGRWVVEDQWPSPDREEKTYYFSPGLLSPTQEACDPRAQTIRSPLSVGLFAGKWCSYSATPDLPHDQREEDGGALVFTSRTLEEPLEILGAPVVELDLSSDQQFGQVAVRLSDVAPDDKATRITYGLLNLTHHKSHENPEPLTPGKRYKVRVKLNDIAQRFPAGHALRISISTSYFPLAWPPPEPVRLTIHSVSSWLTIPVRQPKASDQKFEGFDTPEAAKPMPINQVEPPHSNWLVKRDLARDESILEVIKDDGVYHIEDVDLEVEEDVREYYSFQGDDFNSVRGEVRTTQGFRRGNWHVRTITRTILTSTATHFKIRGELDAYEGDTRVFSRSWNEQVKRELV